MPSKKKKCIECGKEIPGRHYYCKEHCSKAMKQEFGQRYWRGDPADLQKKEWPEICTVGP